MSISLYLIFNSLNREFNHIDFTSLNYLALDYIKLHQYKEDTLANIQLSKGESALKESHLYLKLNESLKNMIFNSIQIEKSYNCHLKELRNQTELTEHPSFLLFFKEYLTFLEEVEEILNPI